MPLLFLSEHHKTPSEIVANFFSATTTPTSTSTTVRTTPTVKTVGMGRYPEGKVAENVLDSGDLC